MDNISQIGSLILSGNVSDNWQRWKQRWNLYLKASGLNTKTADVQCATLLHLIGEDSLRIYNTFDFVDGDEDKLEIIIKKFDEHFNPKKNVTYERYIFNTCNQNGRPFDVFLIDLKNKAKSCEFGSLHDSLIRDRIVCGVDCNNTREKLLGCDYDLPLTKVIEIIRARETTKSQMSDINNNTAAIDALNKRGLNNNNNRNYSKPMKDNFGNAGNSNNNNINNNNGYNSFINACKYCGSSHRRGACPAYGKKCGKCSRSNHFASVCQSSRQINAHAMSLSDQHTPSNISPQDTNNDMPLYINEILQLDSVHSNSSELLVKLEIQGSQFEVKIDTGAQCNVMPEDVYYSIQNPPKLIQSNAKLQSYSGNEIPIIGKCTMLVKHLGNLQNCEFYVVKLSNARTLIGLQSSKKLEIIEVKCADNVCLNDLMKEYEDIFKGLGKVEGKFKIKVDPKATPAIHATRKIPLSILPKLESTLKNLVASGVISKIDEPTEWVNSIVIVEKKNGSLRLCLDAKELNNSIMRQYNTIPTPEEVSCRLHGCAIFTVIDMADCYWHIVLDEESSLLCTFNTPFGRHKFNRLPFGISCASDAAQHMVEKYFGDISGVTAIHDDLIVGASSIEEHDAILKKVFERARESNIKFNLKKIQYRVPSVSYLGNIVSSKGLQPDPSKIEAITAMPSPDSKESLHRFLGMVNFLGQFIPNLAQISAPLRSLLRKDTLWQWHPEHDKAISLIKQSLASQPVLQFFDLNEPVYLQVDASSHGLGACLIQNKHPICYASRTLNDAEKNYAQIEKELLAIVYGCERFNQYIYGRKVTVHSDHKPLQYIFKKPLVSAPPRIQRLLIRLQKYQLDIIYVPGKHLYIADTLSRAHLPHTDHDNTISDDSTVMIHTVISNLPISADKLKDVIYHCNHDPQMKIIRNYISNSSWPDQRKKTHPLAQPFWNVRHDLHELEGIVLKENKIVIPADMQQHILSVIHSSHLSVEKLKARARAAVYWPLMSKQIEDMALSCTTCLQYRNQNQKEPMTIHEVPTLPWVKIGSDIFELNGKYYITAIDYYSKFIETEAIHDKSSLSVIKFFKTIFKRHGIPVEIIADNNPYSSYDLSMFAKQYGFTITTSSPRYPQSNGMSEMAVKTSKKLLTRCDDFTLGILEHNNTPITGMEYSPCQLLMNRVTRTTLPIHREALKPAIPHNAHSKMMELKIKQKQYYDRSSRVLPAIHRNEIVRIQPPSNHGIWKKAIVTEKVPQPNSYIVTTEDGQKYRRNRRDILKTNEQNNENDTTIEDTITDDELGLRRSTRIRGRPKKFEDYICS